MKGYDLKFNSLSDALVFSPAKLSHPRPWPAFGRPKPDKTELKPIQRQEHGIPGAHDSLELLPGKPQEICESCDAEEPIKPNCITRTLEVWPVS